MTETTTSSPNSQANVADVEEALRDVVDPELGINVVDLGLVYGITVDGQNHAVIDMTLTSAACPLTDVIEDQTEQSLEGLVASLPGELGLDAAVGPGQDHRRRPRAAARPRLQHLTRSRLVTSRVVEVGPGAPRRLAGTVRRQQPRRPPAGRRGCAFRPRPAGRSCSCGAAGMPWASRSGDRLTAHKVGTRYVQSRTAAGGWSQQRFARRRANQADGLVGAAVEHAVRLLDRHPPRGVVLGGDKALVASLLEDPRLAGIRDLPRRELYDLPDPRLDVLEKALERGRAVRVTIDE